MKFSVEDDLSEEECQQLLNKYMPDHIKKTKITQRLFIRWVELDIPSRDQHANRQHMGED